MPKTKKEKVKKNHRGRHRVLYKILRPLVAGFVKCKFGYKYKKAKDLPDTYIVLSNHVTDYDPLLVCSSFSKQMYFVASEHITRWGMAYKFIDYVFEPIIRHKGTIASSTVMEILRKIKNGDSVCMFAEGVRSWNGITGTILPSTAKVIKSAKCALVTYKIKGGYFVSPGWSEKGTRKGYVEGSVVNVYSKEKLAEMSVDEIYKIINADLFENAYETQEKLKKKYKGKNLANGLENLLFICPNCKKKDTLKSNKNELVCNNCGHSLEYTKFGYVKDESGQEKTILELTDWQSLQIAKDIKNNITYSCENAEIYKIYPDHSKEKLVTGKLSFSNGRIECGVVKVNMIDIVDMGICGRHELVFSTSNENYELRPPRDVSTMQFLLYYKEWKKTINEK
ncbi:MAG: 1-acyl-sn-glycerol-3-phosphate acyltransferase [Clostridia bacterium]|nr:1-acyl-sn-glycerol-3-phosphate acyltransferase [Clostridia bacterium]